MTAPCITRRAVFAIAALAALAAGPAFAGAPQGAADQTVDLPAMGLPVIVDRKLINYVFVKVRLTLAANVETTVLEGKEPLLLDALIRMAHRDPFTRPDSYVALDEGRLKAAVLRQAVALVGPGKVIGVTVLKQTPKQRMAPPSPRPPAAT